MSKRRTKKEKTKAKHNFAVNWDLSSGTLNFEPNVKRQLTTELLNNDEKKLKTESAVFSGQTMNLASVRRDITKSLILAGLILASELVIYLIWK